ncbi:hypothetical protein [Streptomyces cyaneofuscatus]
MRLAQLIFGWMGVDREERMWTTFGGTLTGAESTGLASAGSELAGDKRML